MWFAQLLSLRTWASCKAGKCLPSRLLNPRPTFALSAWTGGKNLNVSKSVQSVQANEANGFARLFADFTICALHSQLIEESEGLHFGMLIAQPSVFEEMRMPYEAIPILIFLTISLLSGVGLIGDALRRAIHDMRRGNYDLHPQAGPKLI